MVIPLLNGADKQQIETVIKTKDGGFAGIGYSDKNMWLIKFDSIAPLILSSEEVDAASNDFFLFPNPCSEFFNLSMKIKAGYYQLTICDVTGRIVEQKNISVSFKSENLVLPVNNFQDGLYVVTLKSKEQQISHLLIKQ
jgi:hypothetical protein